MAEFKNYTLNFSFGRAARLTFAAQRLACAEIELRQRSVGVAPSKEVC
ncbi:MAG: hypothetical protein PHX10_02635 [Gallionellaceae bacterium]|nr:hypothetical protein [Gallionellaceae bacterium]